MLLIDILIRRLVRIFRGGVFQTYGHSLGTVSTIFRSKIEKLCRPTVPAREDLQVQLELAIQLESIFLFEYGETD